GGGEWGVPRVPTERNCYTAPQMYGARRGPGEQPADAVGARDIDDDQVVARVQHAFGHLVVALGVVAERVAERSGVDPGLVDLVDGAEAQAHGAPRLFRGQ